MRIRTTRAAVLAACLAMQLLGGLSPAHVLCLHHDGMVSIERAARGAVRCESRVAPCGSPGLAATPDSHCHDAAITQPGLGQRAAAAVAATPLVVTLVEPAPVSVVTASLFEGAAPRGSPARARRTIVLRV